MSGSFFFGGMDSILGSRTARQRERAAITIYRVLQARAQLGISIDEVTDKLTSDGVKLFSEAFDKLLAAVEKNTQTGAR